MRKLNATDCFEKFRRREPWWTKVFERFLLHLGRDGYGGHLSVWHAIRRSARPYYRCRAGSHVFDVSGLTDGDVTEPSKEQFLRSFGDPNLPISLGCCPDLVVKLNGGQKVWLIENKTIGAGMNGNQKKVYPEVVLELRRRHCDAEYLFLLSVGHQPDKDHDELLKIQEILGAHFGILLWEDAFRQMKTAGFSEPELNVEDLQQYTAALDDDAEDCP